MDSLDEFMVTLPSNSSMKLCPQNQPSNYTVTLEQEIQLSGAWEVALVDIQYPHNFRKEACVACCYSATEDEHPASSARNAVPSDPDVSIHEKFINQVSRLTSNIGHTKILRLPPTFYDDVEELAKYIIDAFNRMYIELYPNIKFSYVLNRHTQAYEFAVNKGMFIFLTNAPLLPQALGIRKIHYW